MVNDGCETEEQLLEQLERDRAAGESQTVEFMASFPEQAREYAREVAAFSTSNDGIVYLGIKNDGTITGLHDVDTPDGKDRLRLRVTGVHTVVEPPVKTTPTFISHPHGIVLRVIVPKGPEPVYYCDDRPYIRDDTRSRPAKPSEVKMAHEAHFRSFHMPPSAGIEPTMPDARTTHEGDPAVPEFLGDVLVLAASVAGEWGSAELRHANPHIDGLQTRLDGLGPTARELSHRARDLALAPLDGLLDELGSRLDRVGEHPWSIGRECWDRWLELGGSAEAAASNVIDHIGRIATPSRATRDTITARVEDLLSGIAAHSVEFGHMEATSRLGEMQVQFGSDADELSRWASVLGRLWDDELTKMLADQLPSLTRKLWEVETAYLERNLEAMVGEVSTLAADILALMRSAGGN